MKYKTYKTLTKEQKEEYDFRFKDKDNAPLFNVKGLLGNIIVIYCVVLLLFMSMLFLHDKSILEHEEMIMLIDSIGTLLNYTFIFISTICFIEVIDFIIHKVLYYKWIKNPKRISNPHNYLRKFPFK